MYAEACDQLSYDFGIHPVSRDHTADRARALRQGLATYHRELSEAGRKRRQQEARRG